MSNANNKNYHGAVVDLFNKNFSKELSMKNYAEKYKKQIKGCCEFIKKCEFDKEKEASWSPALGDGRKRNKRSKRVMVIAEAPSITEGTGVRGGGLFESWERNKQSPADELRDFVYKKYKAYPYFTDVVKCGVARQNDKTKLNKRVKMCVQKFLKRELCIIKPEIILCCGKTAFGTIRKIGKVYLTMPEPVYLLHYAPSANGYMPKCKQKKRIKKSFTRKDVWKWQVNMKKNPTRDKLPTARDLES